VHDRSPDNWKPLLKISASAGTWLGLSAQAEWEVATSPCGPGRSLADASWVPAWPLLERDPDTIISTLTRATFGHPDVPPLPIDDLVASAMGSGMEYWAAHGMTWAESLTLGAHVAEAARDLSQQSWASQTLRQRARKLASTARSS
jgi:hypothetical protein